MASKIAPFKGQEGASESEYGNETRPTFLSTTRENAIASKRYIQSHPGRWPCKLKVSRSLTFVDEPRRASLSERVARNQYSKRRIKRSSVTCASQVSNSCESLRELAKAALTARNLLSQRTVSWEILKKAMFAKAFDEFRYNRQVRT